MTCSVVLNQVGVELRRCGLFGRAQEERQKP